MFITFMLLLCSTAINAYLEREHKKGIIKRIKESLSKLLFFGFVLFFISVTIMVYIVLIFPSEKIESNFE